ncbi:60S ribosomal protein L19B [Diaporthe eres]|uniref:Ribosomal protein L19 n=1 Tax=Diaporthe eres TaxID=83184 RepID=A0ABR1PAL5_DIAER
MPRMTSSSSLDGGPIYFWRETEEPYGWMSQWYAYEMRDGSDNTIVYPTAEHYMMYQKARLFNDNKVAGEVLAGSELHPRKIKTLGRKVVGFDEATWVAERERIVQEGTWLKMTEPAHDGQVNLGELLLATGDRELVEASPYDQVWGVGFRAKDAERNRERWGLNLLGKALMAVRERLRKDSAENKAGGERKGETSGKETASAVKMVNLVTQKRLAADVLGCGERKIWLDPNEVNEISNANSRQSIRKLVADGLIIRKPVTMHSRARARELNLARRIGRHRGFGKRKGTADARMPEQVLWMRRQRVLRRLLVKYRASGKIDKHLYHELYHAAKGNSFKHKRALVEHIHRAKAEKARERQLKEEMDAKRAKTKAARERKVERQTAKRNALMEGLEEEK